MRLALLATLLATTTLPALADAVTYRGTLDGRDILVELVEAEDGPVGGRFAYIEEGADIPLDPAASPKDMIFLAEQSPCDGTNCTPNDDNDVDIPPRAATWGLYIEDGGATLRGTRTREGEKSKAINIELSEIGRRPFGPSEEATPYALHDRSIVLSYDFDQPFTADNAPYETALMSFPKVESRTETFAGSTVTYMVDPRTVFEFPRVTELADGSDPSVINARLEEFHNRTSLSALECLSFSYAGWGQSNFFSGQGGTLAGYEDETIEVSWLSPQLISWRESGSLYCSGAHPYNHIDIYNYDVTTGEKLDERAIIAAWVPREWNADPADTVDSAVAEADPDAYIWGPSIELLAFLRERMPLIDLFGDDPELLEACASDMALAERLTFRVSGPEELTFAISGAPHVASVCNGDLVAVPLADLGPFLADTAPRYFPSLVR
jgi:hypothetical protein